MQFWCEFHFVDLVCEQVSGGRICLNSQRGEVYKLILLLHSYLQIKAKNYDKVEKVSVPLTLKANVSCVFNVCVKLIPKSG